MDALAEFVNARLDEQAQLVRDATDHVLPRLMGVEAEVLRQWLERSGRDVEAKRAILAQHATEDGPYFGGSYPALRQIAAIDASHPDYRADWTPLSGWRNP